MLAPYAPLSPAAVKRLWPWAANFLNRGSSVAGSAGPQPHEQLSWASTLPVIEPAGGTDIADRIAVSLAPTYTLSCVSPGAMPSAWVMSSVCSVSSQPFAYRQPTELPSVETALTGTLLTWPELPK